MAIELTALWRKQFELDPTYPGVVISHHEGYEKGIASNHADIDHWLKKFGKSMNWFRTEVNKKMVDNAMEEAKAEELWYEEAMVWCKTNGINDGSRPLEICTRGEASVMIKRLYELIKG